MIYDIALLRLETYFSSASDFPSSVGTVCLPTMSMPKNQRLIATGWGGTDDQGISGTQSPDLKEVTHHEIKKSSSSIKLMQN